MIFNKSICSQINQYIALLLRWNATYRLIGEVSEEMVWEKHITDVSVAIPYLVGVTSLIDLGSGPGLPGIPIKILLPKLRVVLVESQRKRVNFCSAVLRELGLTGIRVVHGRAEDPAVRSTVGKSAAVISRATWKLGEFIPMGIQYLTCGGILIAMKGVGWVSELLDVDLESYKYNIKCISYCTRPSKIERKLLVISNK